jgi:hypothetical protein
MSRIFKRENESTPPTTDKTSNKTSTTGKVSSTSNTNNTSDTNNISMKVSSTNNSRSRTNNLANILHDVSDSDASGKNIESHIESLAPSRGGGRKLFTRSDSRPGQLGQPRHPRARTRQTILPDILATESIETMLNRIEFDLSNLSYTEQLGGFSVTETEPLVELVSLPGSELAQQSDIIPINSINNSNNGSDAIMQEIDMLIYKIQSE